MMMMMMRRRRRDMTRRTVAGRLHTAVVGGVWLRPPFPQNRRLRTHTSLRENWKIIIKSREKNKEKIKIR